MAQQAILAGQRRRRDQDAAATADLGQVARKNSVATRVEEEESKESKTDVNAVSDSSDDDDRNKSSKDL